MPSACKIYSVCLLNVKPCKSSILCVSLQEIVLDCMTPPVATCPATQLKSTLGGREQDPEEVAELVGTLILERFANETHYFLLN